MKSKFFVILLAVLSCNNDNSIIPEHKIVARVNNDLLNIDYIEKRIPSIANGSQSDDVKNDMIKDWIERSAVYQEASKLGYSINDDEGYRLKEIEKDIIVQRFLTDQFKDIRVSEKEISDFYILHADEYKRMADEVHLVHLYLAERSNVLFQKIRTAPNLISVISEYNLENAEFEIMVNGDLGYVRKDMLNPLFLKEIKRYGMSRIIGPLKINKSYHFLQVLGEKKAGTRLELSRVREEISQRILIEKIDKLKDQIVTDIKSKYTIINNSNKIKGK